MGGAPGDREPRFAPVEARLPEVFGRYLVYEQLGRGGMATVHRAMRRGLAGFGREVALKRMLPSLADHPGFIKSFVREARLASLLRHPNIVQLYELSRVGDTLYIAMEYIEGFDLKQCLRRARDWLGPPPIPVTLSLLSELLDALSYAHELTDEGRPLGLVHRDVSPSNLLVAGYGNLKIIDFGIARATAQSPLSRAGDIKGKLAYAAPEALQGCLDARADLFSVGVVAHELLTAQPLFGGGSDASVTRRMRRAEPPRPSSENPRCPPELDDLVLGALARRPAERWTSAAAMQRALDALCRRHRLYPNSREVAAWLTWAFGGAPRRVHQTADEWTGSCDEEEETRPLRGAAAAAANFRRGG